METHRYLVCTANYPPLSLSSRDSHPSTYVCSGPERFLRSSAARRHTSPSPGPPRGAGACGHEGPAPRDQTADNYGAGERAERKGRILLTHTIAASYLDTQCEEYILSMLLNRHDGAATALL